MPYEERPYQAEALAADLKEFDAGNHRILNVMATGVGKTTNLAKLATQVAPAVQQAQAGGKDKTKIDEALQLVKKLVAQQGQ